MWAHPTRASRRVSGLRARLGQPKRDGAKITQDLTLANPGVLPHKFKLAVLAKDFIQAVLLDKNEEITLDPGQKIVKTYEFNQSDYGTSHLTVVASSDQYGPGCDW